MASTPIENEIAYEFFPLVRIYKDGRLERLGGKPVPASTDPQTGVQSKDIQISLETGVSARLYLPKTATTHHKLPLLVYFHGGAFIAESAFSAFYHDHLNLVVAEANVIAVSVEYRLAPEHHLPAAYDDSWTAVKWVGSGQEAWLKEYADFERVFFAGDSAGGNIAHNMAFRVGLERVENLNLAGVVLVHPYFGGVESIGNEVVLHKDKKAASDKLWAYVNPSSSGSDDPMFNPSLAPNLSKLGCKRILIFVSEMDLLRDRGRHYHEALGKSGWGGKVEVMKASGEDHVFHLFNPNGENGVALLKKMASFMNQD